jgi:hypothetical protein
VPAPPAVVTDGTETAVTRADWVIDALPLAIAAKTDAAAATAVTLTVSPVATDTAGCAEVAATTAAAAVSPVLTVTAG